MSLKLVSFVVWIVILLFELLRLEGIVNSPYDYGNVVAAGMWIIVTLVVGVIGVGMARSNK